MEPTIFERIISREIPSQIVHEDAHVIAILDIAPKALGHTLVIPKAVSRNLLEMDSAALGHYAVAVQKVARAVMSATGADGCNIISNIGQAAGQAIFHTHTHIIPRFANDAVSLDPGSHDAYSDQRQMAEYAEKIKSHLS